eukprot:Phypoly_transcript_03289.p1 GENE.Phypoly_transcript_03289~~Phypoly_transcript_03289.p1  ORF type:complete len:598 (+),score=74.08 Phypoly_transcript_03289:129-1922(+)
MSTSSNPAKFVQDSPRLGNQYTEDSALQDVLKRVCPANVLSSFEPDLIRWGERVVGDVLQYGRECEDNPPKLIQVNAYGRRVDNIVVAPGWDRLKEISAEEGIVSAGYERKYAEFSRLYQYVKIYLFAPSCAVFDCPLSMTDGGARLIELHGDEKMKREILPHLISRDPKQFWTSGQWMTERTGGSDVGNTETIAVKNPDGTYDISGYKFFTSAITSDSALLLARVTDENGQITKGSKGLSTFLVKIRDQEGNLNGITVQKLKHKLGTRAVPTAELELNKTKGQLVGPLHRGVPVISSILNITRLHNAINAVASMRRVIAVARDYSHRRSVFGRTLSKVPLHLSVLADMEVEFRGALQFTVDALIHMGALETKKANNPFQEVLARVLTPLVKLYTAKQAIAVVSEGIECLGGTGYMEDSDMPRLLRDAQVLSIWEGTTNVLAMDVWRPLAAPTVLAKLGEYINNKIKNAPPSLEQVVASIRASFAGLKQFAENASGDKHVLEASARRFAYSLSRLYVAALLVEHAKWSNNEVDAHVAKRWVSKSSGVGLGNFGIEVVEAGNEEWRKFDRILALDLDSNGVARGFGDKTPAGLLRAKY